MPPTRQAILPIALAATLLLPACSPRPDTARAALAATRHASLSPTTFPSTAPAPLLFYDPDLEATIAPPTGWTLDPPKLTRDHTHKTWLSPDRATAYGVIRFKLPLPVSEDLALWGFLREMRASEGEATLLEKTPDPTLPGLRFVAEGGKYLIRTNLTVRGFRGWCTYAGTLRNSPVQASDLNLAIHSRELTRPGPPQPPPQSPALNSRPPTP